MKRILSTIAVLALMAAAPAAAGELQVVTTYGYIGSIVEKIGGPNVRVFTLARGDYNPHVIIPRPSFIAKVRGADLVVINGAQLEIGWLPPLLRQANNPNVQPGEPGFLDLSRFVTLTEVPVAVSREHGDIHPDGNPHFSLDPENIPPLARAIRDRLSQLDPGGAESYRTNCAEFERAWSIRLGEWAAKLEHLKNVRVVEYHKIFDYLLRRYNLTLAGTVEPQPGIPPTSKHVERLEGLLGASPARFILQDVYNPDDASRHLAEKLGIRLIVLPHDVGSVAGAGDVFDLFDEIVRRLTR